MPDRKTLRERLHRWWVTNFGGHMTVKASVALGFEAMPDGSFRVTVIADNDLGYGMTTEVDLDPATRDEVWELLTKARANGQGSVSTSRTGRTFPTPRRKRPE